VNFLVKCHGFVLQYLLNRDYLNLFYINSGQSLELCFARQVANYCIRRRFTAEWLIYLLDSKHLINLGV